MPYSLLATKIGDNMKQILHYIYDPLCGWCYAAESLADQAFAQAGNQFQVQLHAGGLFNHTKLSEAKRRHIRMSDARISDLTGQIFSSEYLNTLLSDPNTIYDSFMPIRAILAAKSIQKDGDQILLKALQRAHYRSALRIVEIPTITNIAESVGFNSIEFTKALEKITNQELEKHLHSTHELMNTVNAGGYPTFIAQIGNHFDILPHAEFYGKADQFAQLVIDQFK
jgi:putative protein-disulfide isomerase